MKTIKYKGKEYVVNVEVGIPCILDKIEEENKLIKWAKEEGYEKTLREEEKRLAGLQTALFFLTGERV